MYTCAYRLVWLRLRLCLKRLCIDMHADMCIDMRVDLCIHMRVDMGIGMDVEMCIDICRHVQTCVHASV